MSDSTLGRKFNSISVSISVPTALLALGLALASSAAPTADGMPGRGSTPADSLSIELEPCRVAGTERAARCGSLEVPEDRSESSGRRIGLRVVVVPARRGTTDTSPVFFLSGGPGQAATAQAGRRAKGVLGQRRDLVFVDQRWTGGSNPLRCIPDGVRPTVRAFLGGDMPPERLSACLDSLRADPRRYTTGPSVEDLDDVRAALGYERVNLVAASYGTRVALVYARRHTGRIRSMVLRGVTPLSYRFPLPFARASQRALDSLARACRDAEHCRKRYGDPGVLLDRVAGSLARKPRTLQVSGPGLPEPARLRLDRPFVRGATLLSLYSVRGASRLPPLLAAAADGQMRPLATLGASLATRFANQIHLGMFLSVVCSEDAPRIGSRDIEATARGTFLGPDWARSVLEGCGVWPAASVDPDFFTPVTVDVPSLLISGAADPVTPPRWADSVAGRLPRARHVVVPAAGHVPTFPGCTDELARRFLESGSAGELDTSCVRSRNWPRIGS